MIVNGLILALLTGWILKPSATDTGDIATGPGKLRPRPSASAPPQIPTKEQILAQQGLRFGLSAPQVPWSREEVDRIATSAGARPAMLQYFVKWGQEFRPDAVTVSYQQNALPIISWEPWDGIDAGESQPKYALRHVIEGEFDQYITTFATGIRDQRWPVAIRLAHEMNGTWYPWSESRSGNRRGDYVRFWRHVHDIFTQVGATNVIWIWSPNIVLPSTRSNLYTLYPGDAYVDWAGMVGYATRERSAGQVYDLTRTALRTFTQKPIVITETGVRPGSGQAALITDFFGWLGRNPDVVGFVWFEYSDEEGGNQDWRFTTHADTAAAFKAGLQAVGLAPPPVT